MYCPDIIAVSFSLCNVSCETILAEVKSEKWKAHIEMRLFHVKQMNFTFHFLLSHKRVHVRNREVPVQSQIERIADQPSPGAHLAVDIPRRDKHAGEGLFA